MFFQLCLTTFSSFSFSLCLTLFSLRRCKFSFAFPAVCRSVFFFLSPETRDDDEKRRRKRKKKKFSSAETKLLIVMIFLLSDAAFFSQWTLRSRLMTKRTPKSVCVKKQWKLHPGYQDGKRALTLGIFHGETRNVYCFAFLLSSGLKTSCWA